jgi:hypothetical protein
MAGGERGSGYTVAGGCLRWSARQETGRSGVVEARKSAGEKSCGSAERMMVWLDGKKTTADRWGMERLSGAASRVALFWQPSGGSSPGKEWRWGDDDELGWDTCGEREGGEELLRCVRTVEVPRYRRGGGDIRVQGGGQRERGGR